MKLGMEKFKPFNPLQFLTQAASSPLNEAAEWLLKYSESKSIRPTSLQLFATLDKARGQNLASLLQLFGDPKTKLEVSAEELHEHAVKLALKDTEPERVKIIFSEAMLRHFNVLEKWNAIEFLNVLAPPSVLDHKVYEAVLKSAKAVLPSSEWATLETRLIRKLKSPQVIPSFKTAPEVPTHAVQAAAPQLKDSFKIPADAPQQVVQAANVEKGSSLFQSVLRRISAGLI